MRVIHMYIDVPGVAVLVDWFKLLGYISPLITEVCLADLAR